MNKYVKVKIRRGDIFYADLSYILGDNSIQKGFRPVLVVSNNTCNKFSSVITIVPLTAKDKKNIPTHCKAGKVSKIIDENSTILCEQIIPLPVKYIKDKIGYICKNTTDQINKKLSIQLGL